jgi:hypothetical protein
LRLGRARRAEVSVVPAAEPLLPPIWRAPIERPFLRAAVVAGEDGFVLRHRGYPN